jgi:hypothetical protein
MRVAVAVFVLSMAYAVVAARALYDDGSYYFMRVLEAGGFTEMLFHRGHAAFLFQLPVVVALKLGVLDLDKLQIAFGIGCFCAWPLALWLCHRLAPEKFWLAALACAAGYLNAAFVAVGEHVVNHAFFWPSAFAILFARPFTPFAASALLASAAMLVRSYESMLFLGPLLMWPAWQRLRTEEKTWVRIVFQVTLFLLALSVWVAWDGTRHPCTLSSPASFKIGVLAVLHTPGWTIGWTCVWLALMLAGFFAPVRGWLETQWMSWLLGGCVLLWGLWPLLSPADLYPYKQYEARFLDLLVPLGLYFVAVMVQRQPDWLAPVRGHLVRFTALLLLAQSLWHLGATEQWRGYLAVWREMLTTQKGLITLTDTPYGRQPAVGRQATQFVWEMDARDLEVIIGPRQVQALILPPVTESGEVVHLTLLKQFVAEGLPPLQRYGVDYTNYLAALTLKLPEWPPRQ